MIKVSLYKETIENERFKVFLNLSFHHSMLNSFNPVDEIIPLFDAWKYKNMITWHRYTNDDNHVLEFYADYYIIKKKGSDKTYTLPLPLTIDDFINNMYIFGIQIYWTNWIDDNFEPKEYLNKNNIYTYFMELLGKMCKSSELS